MKSSELSNGENRIALRQLLQNRKLRQRRLKKTLHKQTNKQTDKQTDKQTNRHYENNGHLAVNQ